MIDTLANIFIASGHYVAAIVPAGLESPAVLLTWGFMLHSPLLLGVALLNRFAR